MARKSLRVASVEDAPRPPMSVTDAVETGTAMDELVAIRCVLARALDSSETAPHALAALTRRHMEVSREIAALRIEEAEEAKKAAESNVSDQEWRPQAI